MTVDGLKKILSDVWTRGISADDAWDLIDVERERPNECSKEYWLPIEGEE